MDTPHPIRVTPTRAVVGPQSTPIQVRQLWLGGIPRGAVVLLCDTGRLDSDAADAMNDLAAHGYESVAADLTDRQNVDDTTIVDHIELLLDHLTARGWSRDQTGVIGIGPGGGRGAALIASRGGLGCTVSLGAAGLTEQHANTSSLDDAELVARSPLLVMTTTDPGDRAASAPPPFAARLADRSPQYTEVVNYPVPFHRIRTAEAGTALAAAFDSWQRTVEFLDAHVSPRPTDLARRWATRRHPAPFQ